MTASLPRSGPAVVSHLFKEVPWMKHAECRGGLTAVNPVKPQT
ncbi:MAG TPA: hypothetical protein VFC03_09935 [Acidimicrobiales bacterium]|nr:hypothetical protein [Acidimicrobiales bacterium]